MFERKRKRAGIPETGLRVQKTRNGRKKKRILAAAAVLLIAAAGGMILRNAAAGEKKIPTVPVSTVQKQDVTAQVDASGTVISLREKTYFSPVNADILQYDLKVGSVVEKGDLLVSFATDSLEREKRKAELSAASSIGTNEDTIQKSRELKARADDAKANIAVIEESIDEYRNYIRDLNTNIAERSRELSAGDASGAVLDSGDQTSELGDALAAAAKKEELENASEKYRAEIDSLEVEMSRAQFESDGDTADILRKQISSREKQIHENEKRIEELNEQMGIYADMSAEELEAALSGAPNEYSDTPADPSADAAIVQWQLDLSEAEEEMARLQSDLAEEKARAEAGDSEDMTDGAKSAMENSSELARLESLTAEELLEEGKKGIHADFPGIITKAELAQGTPATQGMELVTVASSEDMAVSASVSKYDYSNLEAGQKATIEIGSHTYTGTVSGISRAASLNEKNAPVITCEVRLDHPDEYVFMGVEARVNIITEQRANVLAVPVEAVNTGREGTFCYILENGKIARREVTAGISSADSTEILSGLTEGDLVITSLPDGLEEGMEAEPEDLMEASPDGAMLGGET